MNTGKQINAMVVVLFLTLVAVGIYTIWEPFRAENIEEQQTDEAVERAADTFALNCRLCHGDRGEGGLMGGRLPAAPPLDAARFQMDDDAVFRLLSDTITCGRVGTAMPAWGESQGGTLNEEQIRQLVVLIMEGRWDLPQEHADELDAEAIDHAVLAMAGGLSATATELVVNNADPFSLGQYLRIGEERLRIRRDEIEVARGVDGTDAVEHEPGAEIVRVDPEVVYDLDENPDTLRDALTEESAAIAVGELDDYAVGDVIQIDDELMQVEALVTGLPTTNLRTAEEIGRTPDDVLISAAGDLSAGDVVRIDGELVEITEVREAPSGSVLRADLSTGADTVDVSDPAFFFERYQFRIGDELVEVVGPVETGQLLAERVGRAETTIEVSGTAGIAAGDTIRMQSELLRVTEVLDEAQIVVERGVDDTTAVSYNAGTLVLVPAGEPEEGGDGEPVPGQTGQQLIAAAGTEDTTFTVSGTTRISTGGTYLLGSELVTVVETVPARLRVERGVEDTERAEHPRRAEIHAGRLLEVERGAGGTSAGAHTAGDDVRMTELAIERAVEGSALEDHGKNEEIYLGHQLIVQRGVLETEPAEHADGVLVRDFPAPPDAPAINEQSCGQAAVEAADPGPTPQPGDQLIDVSLLEWQVQPVPDTVIAGSASFDVSNAGGTIHNFRVLRTDLAADALPIANSAVDEESPDVEVVGSSATIQVGASQYVPADLTAGAYVLICNVPGHYQNGMNVGFQVTAP